jgi:MATE family multidrug resistance protein
MQDQIKRQRKTFLYLAIPNIVSNLAVPVAGLIDIAILGHLDNLAPLAGVALASIIFDYAYTGFNFLRMSTTGLTAAASGAKDLQESAAIFARSLVIGIAIGLSLVMLQQPIADGAFALLQGEAAVEEAGRAYFHARIWGAPATMMVYVMIGWLLGQGYARSALVISLALNGFNVIFNVIYVLYFGWGAYGVGLGTMQAEIAACLVAAFCVYRVWREHPHLKTVTLFQREAFRTLMVLQSNLLIRTFCLMTAFAIFTNASAKLGTVVLAANTILLRLLNTASYFIDGFAFALETMAGKAAGARRRDELLASLNLALRWNILCVAGFACIFLFAAEPILGWLNGHEEVIVQGTAFMPWVAAILLLSGFAYIYDGFFIGLARGDLLMKSMLFATLIGFLPLAYWSMVQSSNMLLWLAMGSFMACRAFSLGVFTVGRAKARLLAS